MRYKNFSQASKVLLCLILFGAVAFAQTSWVGEYEFFEEDGETAGGTKIFIVHNLKVEKVGENLKAHLKGNGYMTIFDLYADAEVDGKTLNLYFQKFGDNSSMGSDLKKGDLLLVLEEKILDGKPQILTYWKNYHAGFPNYESSGKVYFKRSINNAFPADDSDISDSNLSDQDADVERQIREAFQNSEFVYVAKVSSQRQVRAGTFKGKHNETVIDYATLNRLTVEKNFKGTERKWLNLETNTFSKGESYLIFARHINSYIKAIKLDEAKKELEILEKIASEN